MKYFLFNLINISYFFCCLLQLASIYNLKFVDLIAYDEMYKYQVEFS